MTLKHFFYPCPDSRTVALNTSLLYSLESLSSCGFGCPLRDYIVTHTPLAIPTSFTENLLVISWQGAAIWVPDEPWGMFVLLFPEQQPGEY